MQTNQTQNKKQPVWWVSLWNTRYGTWDCDFIKADTADDAVWWFKTQDPDRSTTTHKVKKVS